MAQKIMLIDFDRENMVGSWNDAFYLAQTANGRYTVSFKQTAEEYPLQLPSIRHLGAVDAAEAGADAGAGDAIGDSTGRGAGNCQPDDPEE